VHDLLDRDGHHHDAPGYSNPRIAPGDRILRVDDMQCENVSVETLHRMLSGVVHTPVKISLARISDGTSYSVTVLRHTYHVFDDKMIGGGVDCKQAEAVKGAAVEEDWRLQDEADKVRRSEARRREKADRIAQEQREEEEKNKLIEEERRKAEKERQAALAEKQRIEKECMTLEERERAAEVEILRSQLARKIKEDSKREDEAKISRELEERRKMEAESRKREEEAMHHATEERRKEAKEQAMAEQKKQREEERARARMKEEAERYQAEIVQLEVERKEEVERDRKSSKDRALQAMQEARNDRYHHDSELVLQQLNSRGEAGHDEVVMVSAKPKMQRSVARQPEHAQTSAATRAIAVVQMSNSGSTAPSGADTGKMLREAGLARAAANEAKLAEYLAVFKAQEEQENLEKGGQEEQGLPQARVGLQGKAQSNVGSMPG
jgi:hypothetical protein